MYAMEYDDHYTTRIHVKPDWIDHNGHVNVAYFVLAFDIATDRVYENWGLGENYTQDSGCSVFTLGMDVDYLKELFHGDRIKITTQLLDWDEKRIHYYHRMFNEKTGELVAVNECIGMNIDLKSRKSAVFPASVQNLLNEVYEVHHLMLRPESCGKRLGIRRV